MRKFEIQMVLNKIRDARQDWAKAQNTFNTDVEYLMPRLLNEAAANFMSSEEVAREVGMPKSRVRAMMRKNNLHLKDGKRLMAKTAAEALQSNAEIMGVRPHDIDLMSPLAYLPMGKELRQAYTDKTRRTVTELHEDLGERIADCGCCTIVDTVALNELKAK